MKRNWSFENCEVISPNEDHMALLFLCDISGTMTLEVEPNKRRIDLLNDALANFASAVCADPKTERTLEVGIVAFDHKQQIVQPFTNVGKMKKTSFKPLNSAKGGTKIAAAAQFAIDMLNAHIKHIRDDRGVTVRKPWILMITDGFPEHDTTDELDKAISRVRELDAAGKLRFWSFGVGEYDPDTLKIFSGDRAFALQGYNFGMMLDWTVKSMRAISIAATGESPPAPIDQTQGMQQLLNFCTKDEYLARITERQRKLRPKICVTSPCYDDIGQILTSMKINYDKFETKQYDCDVLFLNCGTSDHVDTQKLEIFVKNGGCLYASDLVEDILNEAFPDIFTFAGRLGEVMKMPVDVVDSELREFSGARLQVTFDLGGWVVVNSSKGEVLLRASNNNSSKYAGKPIMIKVKYYNGLIFYTSFHNYAQASEKEKALLQLLLLRQFGAKSNSSIENVSCDFGLDIKEISSHFD